MLTVNFNRAPVAQILTFTPTVNKTTPTEFPVFNVAPRINLIHSLGVTQKRAERNLNMARDVISGKRFQDLEEKYDITYTSVRGGVINVCEAFWEFNIVPNNVRFFSVIRVRRDAAMWLSAIDRVEAFLTNPDLTIDSIKHPVEERRSA